MYIFHYLPIAVISYELHEHAPDTPEVLVYLLVGIGAFVGAFLLNELISRIPILRWCVLGMGIGEKTCLRTIWSRFAKSTVTHRTNWQKKSE